jgi:hypothetical protein
MSDNYPKLTKQELIIKMNEGLRDFLTFLDQYSDEQLLQPTDAAGWNARDHITHLAVWADGVAASAALRRSLGGHGHYRRAG